MLVNLRHICAAAVLKHAAEPYFIQFKFRFNYVSKSLTYLISEPDFNDLI